MIGCDHGGRPCPHLFTAPAPPRETAADFWKAFATAMLCAFAIFVLIHVLAAAQP